MINCHWENVKSLFHKALERPANERESFLRNACNTDHELLEEVRQLLLAFEEDRYFLEGGAVGEVAETIIEQTEKTDYDQHFGRYRIKALLGEGGMGKVFLAEDVRLERNVALKILTKLFSEDEDRVRRFIREAKTASLLNHPNILTIHETGYEQSSHFIATEFVDGETLRRKINSRSLSLGEILNISIQIVSALAAAHRSLIIHRDIKPENIMIRRDGIVKVLDFGIAKLLSDEIENIDPSKKSVTQTAPGIVIGTAAYMSPEQARGKSLDSRTDIWSFGICLYEMLDGNRPFNGETVSDTVAEILTVDPPALNIQIPAEFERIVKKSLRKNCADRYLSAEDFNADLMRLRDSPEDNFPSVEPTRFRNVADTAGSKKPAQTSNPTATVFSRPGFYPFGVIAGTILSLVLVLIGLQFYHSSRTPRFAPEAVRWFESGSEAARNGDFYKAQKLFEQALRVDNRFLQAYAKLAETQMELDYEDKAAGSLLRLTELMPQYSLSKPETEYLLAVIATVRRDNVSAVAAYDDLVTEAPEDLKKFAYFDLGRALEKNASNERAIAAYQEAVRRDSQFAAAFLRLGHLYWHEKQEAEALAAFDSAAVIYTANSNYDGLGELSYQKGDLYNYSEKLPEAEKNLTKALEIAQATGNAALRIKTTLSLGRVEYSKGETAQSQKLIDEALNAARSEQMESLTINGVIDFGTLFFLKGEYDEAFRYLDQALQIARSNGGKSSEARALLSLGSISLLRAKPVEAIKYINLALNFYHENNFRQEKSQALLALGYAYDQTGSHASAFGVLAELLGFAERENDQPLAANTESALGLVLIHEEKFGEALDHLENSYRINQSLGREQLAAYATLNKGQALMYLGRLAEARQILNQTGESAEKIQDKQLDSWVHLLLAKSALFDGQYDQAVQESRKAQRLSEQQVEEITISSNLVLATAALRRGNTGQAGKYCQIAQTAAEKIGNARLLAEINLEQSEIFSGEKKASEALEEALSARTYFAGQQARYSEWRSLVLAAQAASLLGNPAATEYARQAENDFALLEQLWGKR